MSMEAKLTKNDVKTSILHSLKSKMKEKVKKHYMEISEIFIRKTQAEKRRELFGKDPLVGY